MTMELQKIKQRFGIIGNSVLLNRAIDIAAQVAPTDLSVLITGESGTGKESFPQIIHNFSTRKHGKYIPVNCGAIPEGTIDSELFGHEKGSFTGAHESRQGYFEVANNGTIFLDEVAELPVSTQVRLLRVLESGEFMRVGSSKAQKTNVRVIAATNINLIRAIEENKFREDLYYRLNTVPIHIPPLRDRKEDVYLLFRKFATDFAERYRMPPISLDDEARKILDNYEWPGNVRQLKNITEQLSVIEEKRIVTADVLKKYLPDYYPNKLPALYKNDLVDEKTFSSEREILYKILFDMKNDLNNLKKLVHEIIDKGAETSPVDDIDHILRNINTKSASIINTQATVKTINSVDNTDIEDTEEFIEESLSIEDKEKELIRKALERHNGKRKYAAQELGISERTLYRKIKEYDIN
ncbi:MAG: sigma-54-dependent Fis family transcriptional regulator [Bacteroidetes bacterium GWC2_33_15]|nr:MAG: sigma-54-dependent Fis family transcriptional regulator [Bacteroidetes bacterium GWA2_33_15]OFX52004.1 MAG: sigma-54-dependent Fis family transcriptional regulator [Bacteroidetes bacterium GWC2_33_15]OFX63834.1 MAG: sigma-54-dependent Fis family transcriptional regulator [Bacteroidetes bacterium GWB2_32_14]OFX67407.1 MAG: sigma-54-dependent Fis family transcriptional regulator [Bacteroidetes bacterium GWD2_33_33]